MKLSFHPEAQVELHAAQDYYKTKNIKVALAFTDQISWAIDHILSAPERWKLYTHGTRRFLLSRFPHAIIYRLTDNEIQIIAVAHHRRKPNYWAPRVVD